MTSKSTTKAQRRKIEQQTQQSVVQYLQLACKEPDVIFWHTPNGGLRSKAEAGILKSMGVRPGVLDLEFLWRFPPSYDMGLIEMKADDGDLSDNQISFIEGLVYLGVKHAVCRNLVEVITTLRLWHVPMRNVYIV